MIRCFAREAKFSNRLDVVKHLREVSPAGITGRLLTAWLTHQTDIVLCFTFSFYCWLWVILADSTSVYLSLVDCCYHYLPLWPPIIKERKIQHRDLLKWAFGIFFPIVDWNIILGYVLIAVSIIWCVSTGPLLPDNLDVKDVPFQQSRHLSVNLSGE